jgi:hypothetical protein
VRHAQITDQEDQEKFALKLAKASMQGFIKKGCTSPKDNIDAIGMMLGLENANSLEVIVWTADMCKMSEQVEHLIGIIATQ